MNFSEGAAVSALDTIEWFLFRRAVSGIEPTGLHAVFKSLWSDLVGDEPISDALLTPDKIRQVIVGKPTIKWPSNLEFRSAIEEGELYRRKIAPYVIDASTRFL